MATLLLAAGILAPFAQVAAATPRPLPLAAIPSNAAQRSDAPPPIPEPTRVVATGSFQTALGCPANNDPTCAASELTDDGGIWSESFLLPPGQYTYRAFVETPEGDFSLGQGGDPNGSDVTFTVQGDGGGAYFLYDTHEGEVSATPFSEQYVLSVEQLGDFALRPIDNNRYEVFLTSPAGQFPYEVLVNGEPVASDEQINLGFDSRVHIVVDASGETLVKEAIETAAVTVVKTDESDRPLPGSCFALYEGQNTLVNQACDIDDGAEDGQTLLFFPNGVEPGAYDLVETLVPDGQAAAEDQTIQVTTGSQTVEVQVADDAAPGDDGGDDTIRTGGETPTEDASRVIRDSDETPEPEVTDEPDEGLTLELESRDRATGETVPGACYQVETQTDEVCDEDDGDEDGFVNLEGVEPGSYTVTETRPPDGYLSVGSFPLDIFTGGGEEYYIPHDPDPDAEAAADATEATETPEATDTPRDARISGDGPGTLLVQPEDEVTGQPLAGACFTLTDPASGAEAELCDDDDGVNDGTITFLDVPPGEHRLAVSAPPAGYEDVAERTISVTTGQTTTEVIGFDAEAAQTPTAQAGPGSLSIRAEDADGNPLPGAAYNVTNAAGTFGPFRDEDGDGEVIITDVLPGENNIEQVTAPDGFEALPDETVEVEGGQESVVTFEHGAAETTETGETLTPEGNRQIRSADESPTPGPGDETLRLEAEDQNRNTVTGACYQLDGGDEVCDDDDGEEDGFVTFENIEAGTYQVTETRAPDGYIRIQNQFPITVVAGANNDFYIQHQVDPNAAPAEEGTETAGEGVGGVRITTVDADGNPIDGACYELTSDETTETVCDNGDGDAEPAGGLIEVEEIPAGEYTVIQAETPAGYGPAASQTIDVLGAEAGADLSAVTEVTVVNAETAEATGDVVVLRTDEDGDPLGGACFELVDPVDQTVVADEVCDEDGDVADDGRTGLLDVPTGEYLLRETQTPNGYQTAADQTITVREGSVQVTSQAVPEEAETGSVIIQRADEDGGRLGGACFQLTADGDGAVIGPVCDNGTGDADGTNATVRIDEVPAGTYTLAETTTPEGVETPEDQEIRVRAGESARVTIQTEASVPPFGTLRVLFEDGDGNAVTGGCVNVTNDAGEFGPFCDGRFDGINDGVLLIPEVETGENIVTLVTTPVGYAVEEDDASQTVTVEGGEESEVTIGFTRSVGSVEIVVTNNETGEPVAGTCYTLTGPATYGPVCDNGGMASAGYFANPAALGLQAAIQDADPAVGVILIEGIATGEYVLTQTQAPEGVEPFGETVLTVQEDEIAEVEVQNVPAEPETGSVEITSLDEDGGPLAGACFGLTGDGTTGDVEAVCDGGRRDGSAEDGVVTISDVQPGRYTLTETRTPEGYVAPAAQAVTVEAGETASAAVQHETTPPPTGSVVVTAVGPDGATVAGACYSLGGPAEEICDNDANDASRDPGVVRFDDVDAGAVTATETRAPEGFALAEPASQDVTVEAGEAVELTFAHEAAEPETGGVRVLAETPDGEPIEGACFTLVGGGREFGPVCDNDPGDGDDAVASILFADVPVGNYQVIQRGAADGFQAAEARSVAVEAGVTVQVLVVIIIDEPDTADFLVTKWDQSGRLLGGSCFALVSSDDRVEICDGDENDGDGTTGEIRFDDVATGIYDLVETRAPEGYQEAGDQEVRLSGEGDGLVRITVRNQPVPDATGDVVVLKTDPAGDPLGGACFALLDGAVEVARACDEDGDVADDGRIGLLDVPAGTYTLREVRRPSRDYVRAGDQTVELTPGGVLEVTVQNRLRPATLVIEKVDESGAALTGSCFALDGPTRYERCDNDDTAGDDGTLTFSGVVPGDYTLVETMIPAGYESAGDQAVTLAPGQRLVLTVENVPLPPPAESGSLVLFKVDPDGAPLAGACFSLRDGGRTVAGPRCDGADGVAEGTISFNGVAVGTYTLHETRVPSADYQTAADREVTIAAGQTTNVTVENVLKPGRVLVRKVNQSGQLLQGACFDLAPDGQPSQCTDASGTVLFGSLEPGTYRLQETQAPAGFLPADPIEGIVVDPGATTVITVENELAPPPPNTGAIQVFKFYCTATPDGEGTVFFDSSDAGPSPLAQTANCNEGNADFDLSALDTAAGNVAFSTGDDGAYQTTLPAGTYVLSETAPDLPGDARETVVIGVNQLTTVVVLNYVAPPPPAPVSISVAKYTCEPGFAGTIYADFVDNCASDAQRTNGVGFRTSGPVVARGSTGDGGVAGVTEFARLPAGTYTLTEDIYDPNSTIYSFCGLDPNAPAIKTVGATTGFQLAPGNVITCTFFNVPDDLTETTGAIVVHKLVCPVEAPPAGYDFEASCSPQSTPAQFSLAAYSAEIRDYVPRTTASTNADGLLRVSRLQPGLYQLTEIGDAWCYAESDNVDRNGDLIVEAGRRTEVFIYNCSPVEEQPNTGTGTMAGIQVNGGSLGAAGLAISLIWPLAGFALMSWVRRSRTEPLSS
ncbi:MAG TPA: SpaA isopeptide-forming pilin-related protein [Thermomicrobiales bacterium]|nr:SpaA isopeptide-forming pilin-related protein [Thermomicrobiales bacterium]